MRMFDWYQQARARVEQFLPDLDPELEVEVEEDSIAPYDGSGEYDTFVLFLFPRLQPKPELDHGR